MPKSPTLDSHAAVRQNRFWLNLSFVVCVIFGLAMIVNTQLAGDGLWFWYASALGSGHRLYADMHLPLQPLYVLETAGIMKVLGEGWLVSKISSVVHMVAYCLGLLLIVKNSDATDVRKAVLLAFAFFMSICSIAYRFDDYHVLAEGFGLYALVLLLMLDKAANTWPILSIAAGLGALCALSVTTRVNDGAALTLGAIISIPFLARSKRLVSVLVFCLVAALTLMAVIRMTGDTLHVYAMTSIFGVAGAKGGAGSVLNHPFELPVNALRYLRNRWYDELNVYAFGLATLWVYWIWPFLRSRGREGRGKAALSVLLILVPLHHMIPGLLNPDLVSSVAAPGVLLVYGVGLFVIYRAGRWLVTGRHADWDRREILLITPFGQLASAAMSSGGVHYGNYGPTAIMCLLLLVVSPIRLKSEQARSTAIAFAALMVCYGLVYRTRIPYVWHSYRARPLFVGRQWYRHPQYGPMVIERDMLNFIHPVCETVGANDPNTELLSITYPFGNYFCAVAPWHGYIQTFYDTSTEAVIHRLMDELQTAPPKWILYERQPLNLSAHERQFNHGVPLPHRYLEEMIQHKVADGKWELVYSSHYGWTSEWPNDWFLIRTHR